METIANVVPQITFHQFEASEDLREFISDKVADLESIFSKISAIRIWVEPDSHKHRQGNAYRVRIRLSIAGGEIVVNQKSAGYKEREDIRTVIQDAFASLRRQLGTRMSTKFSSKHRNHLASRRTHVA